MTTEYWLQKKTIGGWSHVTWYETLAVTQANFANVSAGNSGYSWRIVEAKTIEEKLLDEVVEVYPTPLHELTNNALKASPAQWAAASEASQNKQSGWGATPGAGWGETIKIINPSPNAPPSVSDGRGAKPGSVWLVHHGKKHKTRVAASEVDAMIAQGYIRGGPATKFEESKGGW